MKLKEEALEKAAEENALMRAELERRRAQSPERRRQIEEKDATIERLQKALQEAQLLIIYHANSCPILRPS
jgi:hypothetical protein